MPKGQALNVYRDFLGLSDIDFEKRYGLSKTKFDAKNFMGSTQIDAKKLLASYASKPIEIKRTEKDHSKIDSVVKDVIYDNIQLPGVLQRVHPRGKKACFKTHFNHL